MCWICKTPREGEVAFLHERAHYHMHHEALRFTLPYIISLFEPGKRCSCDAWVLVKGGLVRHLSPREWEWCSKEMQGHNNKKIVFANKLTGLTITVALFLVGKPQLYCLGEVSPKKNTLKDAQLMVSGSTCL